LEKAFDRIPREVIRWTMCKLGVKEWLASTLISMYTGAKTVVRIVYGNSNCFEVKVSKHQGLALSPLLLVTVMKALSKEFRVNLPQKLLYADDWVVIAETEDDLINRLNKWKNNVKNRGMRVNMNKTKVMISGERQRVTQKAVRWLYDVCGRSIGNKSIQCTSCQEWVHRKRSGIKGTRSMYKVMKPFVCRGCVNPVTGTGCISVDIGVNANLELMVKFC